MRRLVKELWFQLALSCLLFGVAVSVIVNLVGGFANPIFFVGLGLAAGICLALVVTAARSAVLFRWPSAKLDRESAQFGSDERVRIWQHRLDLETNSGRPAAADPLLTELVAERLMIKYRVDLERDPDRARTLLSADLASCVGLAPRAQRALSLAQLSALTDEIASL